MPRDRSPHLPLNFTLASRNLFQDRLRFAATTVGIVFSVVLVMVQMGLYLGFGRMVTTMVEHADADLWVMRQGTKCFEDPVAARRHAQGHPRHRKASPRRRRSSLASPIGGCRAAR